MKTTTVQVYIKDKFYKAVVINQQEYSDSSGDGGYTRVYTTTKAPKNCLPGP